MSNQLGSIAASRALSCLVFGSLVLASHSANATLTLQVSSGATTVTCADGAACDLNGVSGIVLYTGSVNGFNVSATGISGGPAVADIDLSSSILSSAAGTLKLSLSDDFSLGGATGSGLFTIGGTTKGTVTAASYFGNALFSTANLIGTPLGPFGPPVPPKTIVGFNDQTSGSTSGDPFFLTSVVTITHLAGTRISSFDAETEVSVPTPGTLPLLAAGLAALGLFGWRKRHKAAAA